MALSPSHKFGQIIGDLLELAIEPFLRAFADENNLYLDIKGPRPLRGKTTLLSWQDNNGNKHNLDFVLERGGSPFKQGNPVAFVEAAWRKSTKHSKNKVQEIEGALGPLGIRYHQFHPFKGAVLAGDFTGPAIKQLESGGFSVLYFPKHMVVAAFSQCGIDAHYEDTATPEEIKYKVDQWNALPNQAAVASALIAQNPEGIAQFTTELKAAVSRNIEVIHILPLHGSRYQVKTVAEAITLINDYSETPSAHEFVQYEIIVRYNTGTKINGICPTKDEALEFLSKFS